MYLPTSSFIVICGKLGSGKTLLLQQLKLSGYPCIDLERIASHSGTAFGGMALPEQPSQKDFEIDLEEAIKYHSESPYIFIEQKASPLGKRKIPAWLYSKMNEGILVQLNVDKKKRIQNILKEYNSVEKSYLINSFHKLNKRLPIAVMKELQIDIDEENHESFIENMLDYYDKTLKYNSDKKPHIIIPIQTTDPFYITQQLLHALEQSDIIIS